MTVDDAAWLAERFEEHRPRLRAVAYRMLGSLPDADDAVQDAWLRVSRAGAEDVENLGGWLTTIVGRVCLNMLRSRNQRREEPFDVLLPDPIVTTDPTVLPDEEAVLADSVSLALLVLLNTLTPAERLAFVLHDMFGLPFEEIGSLVDRSPAAARQLASRARRRVQGAAIERGDTDLGEQRRVVDAFFRAARGGDVDALVAVLAPDVVLRSDFGGHQVPVPPVVQGAEAVAGQARLGAFPGAVLVPVLVGGRAGMLIRSGDRPVALMGFTVSSGRIAEIDAIADPARVRQLVAHLA